MLKTWGYLISSVSVALLAAAAYPNAAKEIWTLVCLLLGAAASIVGMLCRWLTYLQEHRQKLKSEGLTGPAWP